jgi:hypothetical protein
MYWLIAGITFLASLLVSTMLKRKFAQYARTPLSSGLSGAEVAAAMLRDHGLRGVDIVSVPGHLTDHYNPANRTINLSPNVYHGRNAAAAAVAAHETGHAVQHATAYNFLQFRSAMVPVLSFTNNWIGLLMMGGIGLWYTSGIPWLFGLGVLLFAATTVFSFITLPVEFDASRRATEWLERARVLNRQELAMSKNALWWAAMTYVVAALGSLATLLYYLSIFRGRE